MQTNIKFTDTEVDDKLRLYAESKVAAFNKLLSPEELDAAVCNVEFKRSTHHRKGNVCYAEVTLEVCGKVYRSHKEEPTLRKAIDKVKDDILQGLRVTKEKTQRKFKKGATTVKEMVRGEKG